MWLTLTFGGCPAQRLQRLSQGLISMGGSGPCASAPPGSFWDRHPVCVWEY